MTRDAGIIVAAWAVLTFFHAPIMGTPFSEEVEAREACNIAEVARKGRWLAPRPNDEFVPTKPPLLYWWAGTWCIAAGGTGEVVIRWSVSALALITMLATYAIGARLWDRRTGLWGALLLSTQPFFWVYFVRLRVDMALVAACTVSIAGFVFALTGSRRGALVGWIALGLGCLAKGPAAPPVVGIPVGLYLIVTRDREGFRRCISWAGIGLFAAMTVGWLLCARSAYGPGFWDHVWRESASRAVDSSFHGADFQRPFYYYGDKIPAQLGAALILIVPGLAVPFLGGRREAWLPWLWFVGLAVFYSAVAYKRDAYLLPLHPAAALLGALALREGMRRSIGAGAAVVAIAGLVAGGLALGEVLKVPKLDAPGLLLVVGFVAAAAAAAAWRGRLGTAGVATLLCAAGAAGFYGLRLEAKDRRVGPRPDLFAARVVARVGEAPLGFAPGLRDFAMVYYTGRTIPMLAGGIGDGSTYVLARPDNRETGVLDSGEGSSGPLVLVRPDADGR